MTDVAFHTGLADKIGYACRLLRKASRQGLRVRVVGDADELALLDTALWTFEPLDFLPHVRLAAGAPAPATLQRTPVWLTHDPQAWPDGAEAPQVLVNLGSLAQDPPGNAASYARVVELVADDAEEKAAGRRRWRWYEAQGLAPQHVMPPPDA